MSDDYLIWDKQKDKKIADFYSNGNRIRITERVILGLTIFLLTGIIAATIYCALEKQFIFKEYIRDEGPPGTIRATETRKILLNS